MLLFSSSQISFCFPYVYFINAPDILAYADDINILGDNANTVTENTEKLFKLTKR